MNIFTERAVHIIAKIPSGYVMTYGQVAKLAGSPRAARQVVRILHSMSDKYNLPWHRVINSKGEIGFQDDELFKTQKMLLVAEGILFTSKKGISLKEHGWDPDITNQRLFSD